MQTAKTSKASPSKVQHKASPAKFQTARRPKTGTDSDSASPHPTSRTPKERSPNVVERKSPRSTAPEKHPSMASQLESQLGQLQEELKKTKEQLSSSESGKKRAQKEAEEAKKQLLAMSTKYEDSQQQLVDLSASEEVRVQELRKISHDRDQAWESEVEAIQKRHSMDTAALASALNEIQKLKMQLEMAGKSEAAQTKRAESAYVEIQDLRKELAGTLSLVDKMKSEITNCKEAEAQTLELVSKTQAELETAKATEETLRSEALKAKEAYNLIAAELEEPNAKVNSVEELVSKLQDDLDNSGIKSLEAPLMPLVDPSSSEEDRVQELPKISHDRDQAWESDVEAIQKPHSMDTAALASALNEIQKLKTQLEMAGRSEAAQTKCAESAYVEIQDLRQELAGTLSLVDRMKSEITDCKEVEAQTLELVTKTQAQLETAKVSEETLRSDALKAKEAYDLIAAELEQSNAKVISVEEHVSKLQADLDNSGIKSLEVLPCINEVGNESNEHEESDQLGAELNLVKLEAGQLRSALEAAEVRYQEEYVQSTFQIRLAYEQVEQEKSESCLREGELKEELKRARAHIEETKANMMVKETELHSISEENEALRLSMRKAKADIEELKANLMDKETELQSISEENEALNLRTLKNQPTERETEMEMQLKKLEADLVDLNARLTDEGVALQNLVEENESLKFSIEEREMSRDKTNSEAVSLLDTARAAEREALVKLGYLTEEAEKNSRRALRVTEQLDAAQAANSALEAEMRRLKVQLDQWRKAAEAAAAMLSPRRGGKLVDRTGSLDNSYQTISAKMSLPYSDDSDDEDMLKKKNGNMLKKIGVLWKKSHSK